MEYILITAASIAVCSAIGAVIGFFFENIRPELEDAMSGAAAGVMLCAAVFGLILPSLEFSVDRAYLPCIGIFCGALFLTLINLAGPRLCRSIGMASSGDSDRRALLFVLAIAIHHFPEGMIIIPPLLKSGVPRRRAVTVAVISGLVEVVGVFFGYFAITISTELLPFALAFAAGTMLYVIVDDLVPQTHIRSSGRLSTYSLLLGFCLMLLLF